MAGEEVKAGGAFVEVRVRDRIQEGLKRIAPQMIAFGKSIAAIGTGLTAASAGATAALGAAVNQLVQVGGEVEDMAARTGMTARAVAELGHVAEQSGASMGDLEAGVRKVQDTLGQATQGVKSATAAFARLGLDIGKMLKLSPEAQLHAIADGLAKIKDPALRTAVAMDVLGKAGTKLLPMLSGGSEALREAQRDAAKLGITMSKATVTAAGKLGDALGDITKATKFLAVHIGAALAPAITEIVQRVTPVIGAISAWVRNNEKLIVGLASAVGVVGAIGAALTAVGGIAVAAGMAMTSIGTIAGAVFTPLGAVVAGAAVAIGAVTVSLYNAVGGFSSLVPIMDAATKLFGGMTAIIGKSGIAGLGDMFKKASAVMFSFMRDVLEQWPRMAGFAAGRVFRVLVDGMVYTFKAIGRIVVENGKKIVQAFPAALKDLLSGDVAGAMRAIQSVMSGGFSDAVSGFLDAEEGKSLNFGISDRTRSQFAAMSADLENAQRSAAKTNAPSGEMMWPAVNPFANDRRFTPPPIDIKKHTQALRDAYAAAWNRLVGPSTSMPNMQQSMGVIGKHSDPKVLQQMSAMEAHLRYMREQSMRGRLIFAK